MSKGPMETRSHMAVLSWILAGVVNALRSSVPYGLRPGPDTISFINKIRSCMEAKPPHGIEVTGPGILPP